MSVLIVHATARQSSVEIAQQIADRLVKSGFAVSVRPVQKVESIQSGQPVVLGSDLYEQEWLPDAFEFLRRFSVELARSPVWLFSAGPKGERSLDPKVLSLVHHDSNRRAAVAAECDTIRARDHRLFSGEFERGAWSMLGDLFSKICGGSPADHRDWRDINAWASDIARELQRLDHLKERRRLHLSVRGRP